MKDGAIADETRIQAALPTLRYLRDHGARTVILSHLGRPNGEPNPKYSLRPLAARLGELLGRPVRSCADCVGDGARPSGRLRRRRRSRCSRTFAFTPRKRRTIPAFARQLARAATSTSTMPSARPTARTPPPPASPRTSRLAGF